jgi:hypothetical protein
MDRIEIGKLKNPFMNRSRENKHADLLLVVLGKRKLLDRYFAVADNPVHSGVIGSIPRRVVFPLSTFGTPSIPPGKTCGAPAANSKTVRTFSSLSVLRLILGRFAKDMIPDLSSLSSSVGLGPRFHFDGDEGV